MIQFTNLTLMKCLKWKKLKGKKTDWHFAVLQVMDDGSLNLGNVHMETIDKFEIS